MLDDQKIGLFITGGIASYKMAELARLLIKQGAQVRVVMSESATEFISPLTFQILTQHDVLTNTFEERHPKHVQHIEMAQWCDVAVLAPATANILGKLANGIADDIVSTTLMAIDKPIIISPAMNDKMLSHPATQRNLAQLKEDGHVIIEPDTGFLAEGYEAKGRLPELERIVDCVIEHQISGRMRPLLRDKKVVITAGGTIERIDPVRYISNDSSGKMGYAMARAAQWYGGEVTLISTKRNLSVPHGIEVIYVDSAMEMKDAVEAEYADAQYVVMAAAVSDYRVKDPADQKIKKTAASNHLTIDLIENPDILAGLGAEKEHQVIIGFAAETENLIENAKGKLERKNADWIVANDVSQEGAGFNVDTNQVTLISSDKSLYRLPNMSKLETALSIWQTILEAEDRS
ncbi:bifunctional phosphopantothenoylcysteine decarboxylase/phosphopantothenate--cysteine ligase CoaBC [Aerococcaceae bacterium DSM 111020]|nr:bifunctional phosphopantothenoylcysteine decarboxylase/phosphopantothenate--cysteine ligase CoaBC [Aerococcaceae bacterium DSM 111020]